MPGTSGLIPCDNCGKVMDTSNMNTYMVTGDKGKYCSTNCKSAKEGQQPSIMDFANNKMGTGSDEISTKSDK